MKESGLTRQERSFIALTRALAFFFFGAALASAFIPDIILDYITRLGIAFFDWKTGASSQTGEPFWLVLSSASLFCFAYMSFVISRDPLRNIIYARAILLGKLLSTVGFLLCFFLDEQHFFYLVAAITDGLISIALFFSYRAAVLSRPT